MLAALDSTADEKLNGFALRIVLSEHIGLPQENQPDFLTEAEQVFTPRERKPVKVKATASKKAKAPVTKNAAKRTSPSKIAA